MSTKQFLRIIWARKWLVLLLFVLAASGGIAFVLTLPKQYVATSSLVVDMRSDPLMGALSAPLNMATQVDILTSDRVATRVVKMLGVERSPSAVQQWREATGAKIPLDRYFADLLQKGLAVDPGRRSNVITINFASQDAAFAASAANAFAQAAMDVSVEMRVEPARQSATFFDAQTKSLRTGLEAAQAKLSSYQQANGIVVSDERLDSETARYNALTSEIAAAQAANLEALGRQRNTGSELSPDIQQSGAVQGLKGQLAMAETKMNEISGIVGPNHPQRQQLDAQIAGIKQQLAAEMRRVSGGTSVVNRASSQKVVELRALAEAQKKQLLSMRSQRDQIAVLVRDVDTAQRAYDAVSQRVTQVTMESQTNQSMLRLLSQAVEPFAPSRSRQLAGILGSLVGGMLLAAAVAVGLELLTRRVRGMEDLMVLDGVPVIGILRPAASKRPVFRQLSGGRVTNAQSVIPFSGTRQ